jgi:sarcosine oxidase subunit beta
MIHTADAVLVGAGVIGAAIAFELAKNGRRTISVDRNREAGHGSTSGSCAIIRVHYSTLPGTAFAWEGYHYWKHWADYLETADERGLAPFRETGCIVMKTDQNGEMARHAAICGELGIPVNHLDKAGILERLPLYDLSCFFPAKLPSDPDFAVPTGGEIGGAVFFPTAGYVTDPALSAHNLQHAAEAKGGRFLLGREVVAVLQQNGRASGVRLADGDEIHAPVVVNVAGPAAAALNAMAGVLDDMTIATRALRQEVVHLPLPEGFWGKAGPVIVSDSDIACYSRPEGESSLLVGSEDPPCDEQVWIDDDRDYDRNFTEQWRAQALRMAQRAPALQIPSRMRGVVDLYDVAQDWIPVYDRSSLPGYYMACGTSGNQYKNAAIAGKLMAALIDHCETGGDHDAQPLRFTMPMTGLKCDAGFFSRRRSLNSESSFSVLG